ncbi:potassium-transporting ATPase subunit KdpA (plasmid) [Methylocystis sp. MJC1]|jgi:K+-transporting ATPase ATPase A chain|uniref:potassium-transporting ATPase subunit KdpA n=1 Tax=Methylocystis sp. MJC1 TaxID=2654282 RepID=UPI0013ECBB1E|nr:potassium-transporting ATPase subunit KdpA [Methylocystis sp. MJC1]KAF2989096.1 Potassium-transporting ATPase potassium-binding subunit [Methylocystis sp. MJC1]MBU6529125.1 potassium-transporting ATPase subunit KdpA [Methylocystis sp. MJC1]UZX14060.1 potassium-transporting ATPase subunit KdpA [Methylocystis sp. MJC1]
MTAIGLAQIAIVLVAVIAAALPLGAYIARVMGGEHTALTLALAPIERGFYKLSGVDPAREQNWLAYAMAMLAFSIVGLLSLYALQRLQGILPLNPQGFAGVPADLAFNTSVSFVTNTNWQNYAGETTMSHLTQMLGLTVHNFVSAATGLAMAFALVRGFARSESSTLGNFWVDLTRATLYVLLPMSIVLALAFVALGVPQTIAASTQATTLEGIDQVIALGPVASQEAIKELGTNGGGFFNANSAHPFENPNALSNMLEIWALLVIPFASVVAFGRAVLDARQGRAVATAMGIVLLFGALFVYWAEAAGNPLLTDIGVDPSPGNMEGKEVRLGVATTALFAAATTGTSCGAVNAMHDSFTPLGGLLPMFNMLMGSIAPGGVGAGLYGFLMLAVIAVFVAGLMVGRTPEYLGKKIETREMKLAMLAVLIYPLTVLGFTAASVMLQAGLASMNNAGPHGLSEVLYAFASANDNNGSAFAGLSGNTLWYNTTLGVAMFVGRFLFVIPLLAMAGSFAAKKKAAASVGTFPTHGPLFIGLLLGVIVILYLLQYFPALALGPIVEHLLMTAGKTF